MRKHVSEVGIITVLVVSVSLCLYAVKTDPELVILANTATTAYFAFKKKDNEDDDDKPPPDL